MSETMDDLMSLLKPLEFAKSRFSHCIVSECAFGVYMIDEARGQCWLVPSSSPSVKIEWTTPEVENAEKACWADYVTRVRQLFVEPNEG